MFCVRAICESARTAGPGIVLGSGWLLGLAVAAGIGARIDAAFFIVPALLAAPASRARQLIGLESWCAWRHLCQLQLGDVRCGPARLKAPTKVPGGSAD